MKRCGAARLHQRDGVDLMADSRLTVRQTDVLLAFKRAVQSGRKPKQWQLAAELGVSHARIGQLASVLVGKGALVRDEPGGWRNLRLP